MAETSSSSARLIKILVVAALILALAFLYWSFFLDPILQDINQAQDEKEQLAIDIEALNRKLAQKPAVEQEWRELQEDAARMEVLIPSLERLPWVLGNLEQLLVFFPVTIQNLSAGEINVSGQHADISMDLGVSGRDDDLLSLLEHLEGFMNRVVIEQVSWNRSEGSSHLSLQFKLVLLP